MCLAEEEATSLRKRYLPDTRQQVEELMSEGRTESDARDLHRATGGLFLVRLWPEAEANSSDEWRGRLLHVTTGKAHSFHDWPELINLLAAHMYQVCDQGDDAPRGTLTEQPP